MSSTFLEGLKILFVWRNLKGFVSVSCWWPRWVHAPDSLWKLSHLSTDTGTFPHCESTFHSLCHCRTLSSSSLSVQAVKLSSLQLIWRTWNRCFGGSTGSADVCAVTVDCGGGMQQYVPYYNQSTETSASQRRCGAPVSCLNIFCFFYNKEKLIFHISIIDILSYLKIIKFPSFIFIWNTQKFLQKQDSWSNKGSICFEQQHRRAGTGSAELLGPYFYSSCCFLHFSMLSFS